MNIIIAGIIGFIAGFMLAHFLHSFKEWDENNQKTLEEDEY